MLLVGETSRLERATGHLECSPSNAVLFARWRQMIGTFGNLPEHVPLVPWPGSTGFSMQSYLYRTSGITHSSLAMFKEDVPGKQVG